MKAQLNSIEHELTIPHEKINLNAILGLPKDYKAIIIFAHGSGSGCFSSRNNFVAGVLQKANFGTLLLDLLSDEEAENRQNVFDIGLLASRLNIAKAWLLKEFYSKPLKVGFFGASTGAGAAIQAIVNDPKQVFAFVSRGGRPDLAEEALALISIPTLLVVGGNDGVVIDLNRSALEKIKTIKELIIVPGATHLFEEPGTLEMVAELAKNWFEKYVNDERVTVQAMRLDV